MYRTAGGVECVNRAVLVFVKASTSHVGVRVSARTSAVESVPGGWLETSVVVDALPERRDEVRGTESGEGWIESKRNDQCVGGWMN